MPNVNGTLSSALIVQQALSTLFKDRPMLKAISTDFTNGTAKLNQDVISRIHGVPTVGNFGDAANANAVTDVTVKITNFKQVMFQFTPQELASTDRDLIAEKAEPIAIAIADHLMAAAAALWTAANYTSTAVTASIANTSYDTVVDLRAAMSKRGVRGPKTLVVNADAYAALAKDTFIVGKNTNPGQDAIGNGILPGVSGFDIVEYPDLPTTGNLSGFALTKDALVVAARIPEVEANLFPGNTGVVTDPGSGFSVLVDEWVDPLTRVHNLRMSFMTGYAVGNQVCGQILKTA